MIATISKRTPKPVWEFGTRIDTLRSGLGDHSIEILFKQNDELYIFHSIRDIYYDYKIEKIKGNKDFLDKNFPIDVHSMYPISEKMPFSSVFTKKSLFRDDYWSGILYSKIPLGKDTLYIATESYLDDNKIQAAYTKHSDDVEQIESFANITLYSNKNINYKLLRIKDNFFIVKNRELRFTI
ncbi:hypothetical protein [Capnocytophaga catalasegens]|uniref:Uncharacterized protein n=1 Tax=Capnocytophaga catalasegens TaxID=1004260 RepID=A0AAV5ARF6_9FLAO|nr:hypothetical protein [Capnocytophaga catalasegens]GIZ16345.1 hypothetical protein RCZ03_23450 [Capnocytophaga catalasegens]GJM49129.1 hypothetical protein RCZ15_01050 [Capnocytophaga catalasegens]GJM53687.1 hypothetical protein RCZ16_20030 [Capnocytophaga catalasegens]